MQTMTRAEAIASLRAIIEAAEIVPARLVTIRDTGTVVGRCAFGQVLHVAGVPDERLVELDLLNCEYEESHLGATVGAILDEAEGAHLRPYVQALGSDRLQQLQDETDGAFLTNRELREAPANAKARALGFLDRLAAEG